MHTTLHLVPDCGTAADGAEPRGSESRGGGPCDPATGAKTTQHSEVSQRSDTAPHVPKIAFVTPRRRAARYTRNRPVRFAGIRVRAGSRPDDEGAVTAEYAVVILAAVAFAGVLVAIMRSSEIRAMLVDLVQNALGTGG